MELDNRPASAKFTASVDTRIVAANGSMCAVFEAGQTRIIPKALFDAALTHGLVPEEPLEMAPPPPANKPQKVVVEDGLLEACKTLIIRGNPQDFTMSGKPRAASVKKLVDFNFTTKDVERAFEEAMHEVEQDGDDDTQHSEPVISAAE